MPSLRITTNRKVFNALSGTEEGQVSPRQSVMTQLRQSAAFEFMKLGMMMEDDNGNPIPLTDDGVDANWFIAEDSQNEVSIQVEIIFSTNQETFQPTGEQLRGLIKELAWTLMYLDELANLNLSDGAVWHQPIPGGEYLGFEFKK